MLPFLVLASLPLAVLAANQTVFVGFNNKIIYEPETISAKVGDFITFEFVTKNHTVSQSTFDKPCKLAQGGFDTGFKPANNETHPTALFEVKNDKPIWFYCKQQLPNPHCVGGMVFAINPPPDGDNTFEKFKEAAMKSGNATATTSSSATDTFVTPPPQSWTTAVATMTDGTSVITTTYTSYEGSASPTKAAVPQTHQIDVGADGNLTFSPPNITAVIGDSVQFNFKKKTHGVTESTFSAPCDPKEGGFASGLKTVNDSIVPEPFILTVNDTSPMWAHCPVKSPKDHCGSGMVFSINAVETGPNNFATFLELALRSGNSTGSQGGGSGSGGSSGGGNSTQGGGKGANSAVSSLKIGSSTFVVLIVAVLALFM